MEDLDKHIETLLAPLVVALTTSNHTVSWETVAEFRAALKQLIVEAQIEELMRIDWGMVGGNNDTEDTWLEHRDDRIKSLKERKK